jgi:L-alanine-DL-glutamate epimerase-like enolase superfamily enzyme
MIITSVECFVLLDPCFNKQATNSAQDDLVVRIRTDDGYLGIGEVDVHPWAAKALIEAPGTHSMGLGLKELLIGQDPLNLGLWDELYVKSAMNGRRGLGVCAIGALDMALWDLRGKILGQPVWRLLGGSVKSEVLAYASLLPQGKSLDEQRESLVDRARQAVAAGFRAIKLETIVKGPYAHNALQEGDEAIIELVRACREAVGPNITMMVDVGYCWPDAQTALRGMRGLVDYDLFFLETPLSPDDLDGHAYLVSQGLIRIASGEWLTTRYEFADLMDRGRVDVVQPDVGRVGGITEALRVIEAAQQRRRLVVPHCWKSAIGIAASVHVAAVASNCPMIEFLPSDLSDSGLRRDLVRNEPEMRDGSIPLPQGPGLGVEVDERALFEYNAIAKRVSLMR